MRLEMGNIYIKDIQFADTSKIEDGILYVDKGAVKAVALEDEHIKTVTFDIAKPGESVRITPVKDVIEPRVKVEGKGGVFPGIISKVDTVGSGKTYALKGMAVVTAGRIVGFQEGIIDMTGVGAQYTPFSKGYWLRSPMGNAQSYDTGYVYVVDLVNGSIHPASIKPLESTGNDELDVTTTYGIRPAFIMKQD